jgi:hypothetical protein
MRRKKLAKTSMFSITMVATTTKTMSTWLRKKRKAMVRIEHPRRLAAR